MHNTEYCYDSRKKHLKLKDEIINQTFILFYTGNDSWYKIFPEEVLEFQTESMSQNPEIQKKEKSQMQLLHTKI